MTEQEIMQLARDAGCIKEDWLEVNADFMQSFAALVAEREREACAKVCDDFEHQNWEYMQGSVLCADAIRARGGKGGAE